MTLKLLLGVSITLITTVAYGGVKEKKAQRKAQETIAVEVESMKSACGNLALTASVDWANYATAIANSKAILEKRGDPDHWTLDHGGERTVIVIKQLSRICADADYKEEIAKITSIEVTAKDSLDEHVTDLSLDGTTLIMNHGHLRTRSPQDFEDRLKALF